MFIRRLQLVVMLCLIAAGAAAQTPPAPVAPPTPGAGGFSTNGSTVWTRSITLGGQFTSAPFEQGALTAAVPGLTGALAGLPGEQHAVQGSLSVLRAAPLHAVDVEASYTYVSVQPQGTVTDVPKFSIDYDFRQNDKQTYFFLTRYAWYKDSVRHVDFSHQAMIGVGLMPIREKKVNMSVAPVVGVLYEHKDVPAFDDRALGGWGAIERVMFTPNPFVQISQSLGYVQAFNDSTFRVVNASGGMKGKVSKNLSVTFDVSFNYDNVIAQARTPLPIPGVGTVFVQATNRTQVLTTAGLQISF